MKVRENYKPSPCQLFSCSETTIANIVTTLVHVLHNILFNDIMTTIPSIDKNSVLVELLLICTDIEVAAPGLISQDATY